MIPETGTFSGKNIPIKILFGMIFGKGLKKCASMQAFKFLFLFFLNKHPKDFFYYPIVWDTVYNMGMRQRCKLRPLNKLILHVLFVSAAVVSLNILLV